MTSERAKARAANAGPAGFSKSDDDGPVNSTAPFSIQDYHGLKQMAAELGRPLSTLTVLADDRDPFIADRPGKRLAHAEWFADVWRRLKIPNPTHLRRLHYLLVSTSGVILPSGETYQNTFAHWKLLGAAAGDARYLGLVDPNAFVDRRSEAFEYHPADDQPGTIWALKFSPPAPKFAEYHGVIVRCDAYLSGDERDSAFGEARLVTALPALAITTPSRGAFGIELWVEKSTINDELLPLARRRGVGLVVGTGDISITACHSLVRRILEHRRPTRILYLADHDPGGASMPVAVARKIEFWVRASGESLDVQLIPLQLTAEQVRQYGLPRIPIKESDPRKAAFEAQNGDGAVELDALQALYPGELARIVNAAIDRFEDKTIARRTREFADDVARDLREIRSQVYADHAEEIAEATRSFDELKSTVQSCDSALAEAKARFESVTAEAKARFEAAIAPAMAELEAAVAESDAAKREATAQWTERANPLFEAIADDLEAAAPDVNELDWPELEVDEFEDPLYNSRRSYLDQIEHYKAHQGKPTARRRRGTGGRR